MLLYPEVYTDLIFVSICTIPLELCVEKKRNLDAETNVDGFLLPVFRIKFVLINRTYQIGVNITLTNFFSLMIYNSWGFMLIKLINFPVNH